jgi:hypothetical protein
MNQPTDQPTDGWMDGLFECSIIGMLSLECSNARILDWVDGSMKWEMNQRIDQ